MYTSAFVEYFSGRELRITSAFTPAQSLLRYFKKRDELKAYGNDSRHIDLVRAVLFKNQGSEALQEIRTRAFLNGNAYFSEHYRRLLTQRTKQAPAGAIGRIGAGVLGTPMAFGRKYQGLYERFAPLAKEAFLLTAHPKKSLWLTEATPQGAVSEQARALPTKPTRMVPRFWQIASPAKAHVQTRRALFSAFVQDYTQAAERFHPKERAHLLGDSYVKLYALHGDDYLQGIESSEARATIIKICAEHEEVQWSISGLSFSDQMRFITEARRRLKKIGLPDAWGFMRDVSNSAVAAHWLKEPEHLDRAIERLSGSRAPLVPAAFQLPLPAKTGEVTVMELTSSFDLANEGTRMRHCVGGYAYSVQSNRCRIVSFRGGPSALDCATAEWGFEDDWRGETVTLANGRTAHPLKVRLVQLRSFANREASAALVAAEASARETVNTWLAANIARGWEMLRGELPAPVVQPSALAEDFPF